MKRYWVPEESISENRIDLDGDIFHHIHRVCRNEVGAKFELLAGENKAYFCVLREALKKSGWAEILEVREIAPIPRPYIHLAVSLPRFQKMDWIIEKAVELGAYQVHPFVSDYSFVRKIDSTLVKKEARWGKIVQGATQQSGRGTLMNIAGVQTLDQLLEDFNQRSDCLGLFPYEGDAPTTLNDALRKQQSEASWDSTQDYWIFVGSEGGFSRDEVQKFENVGLQPVTLGEQILRVDTACVALLSIIKYELGRPR